MKLIQALPPISIGADDFHRLSWLAEAASTRYPDIAAFLERELRRAELVEPWFGLVTMGSTVRYVEDGGRESVGRLVYPADVARHDNAVSILSEVGVALLGLCESQTIRWRGASGHVRSLSVLRAD